MILPSTKLPPLFYMRLIARILCECDGKIWLDIDGHDRDRYARIAITIEERIRAHDEPLSPQGWTDEQIPEARAEDVGLDVTVAPEMMALINLAHESAFDILDLRTGHAHQRPILRIV